MFGFIAKPDRDAREPAATQLRRFAASGRLLRGGRRVRAKRISPTATVRFSCVKTNRKNKKPQNAETVPASRRRPTGRQPTVRRYYRDSNNLKGRFTGRGGTEMEDAHATNAWAEIAENPPSPKWSDEIKKT